MAKSETQTSDIAECRAKIRELLTEYNCMLISADEWHDVLLYDHDTKQYANMNRR